MTSVQNDIWSEGHIDQITYGANDKCSERYMFKMTAVLVRLNGTSKQKGH